jgi:hypothetical protein
VVFLSSSIEHHKLHKQAPVRNQSRQACAMGLTAAASACIKAHSPFQGACSACSDVISRRRLRTLEQMGRPHQEAACCLLSIGLLLFLNRKGHGVLRPHQEALLPFLNRKTEKPSRARSGYCLHSRGRSRSRKSVLPHLHPVHEHTHHMYQ